MLLAWGVLAESQLELKRPRADRFEFGLSAGEKLVRGTDQDSERPVKAILDAYNPTGATSYVNFTSSKETRWLTAQVPHQRGRLR